MFDFRVAVDGRVLKHKKTTGVERYTREIIYYLRQIYPSKFLAVLTPPSYNRIIHHLWEHTLLPLMSSKYDILFCPSNMCSCAKFSSLKTVVTIHDTSFLNFPDSYDFFYRKYYEIFTNRIARISDFVITVSLFEKNDLVSKYKNLKNKITYIHSGVDPIFLKSEVTLSKKDYILYVGNLSKIKNFHGLIKAFSLVYKEIDKKLIVVGMKPDIMKIDKSVNDIIKLIPDEYIEFKGHINNEKELRDLYRKATAFVSPSFYESFGFPLLEAMACGAPVVASRVAAIPEICRESAVYINPFDIEDICDGIVKVVKDDRLRERLITSGRERALEFTWEKSAKKHLEVFERVISGS